MNFHPHSSSNGDGRQPHRDRKLLSVHDGGTSKNSKKRQQRGNRASQMSDTTHQAHYQNRAVRPTSRCVEDDANNSAFLHSTLVRALAAAEEAVVRPAPVPAQAKAPHNRGASDRSKGGQQRPSQRSQCSETAERASYQNTAAKATCRALEDDAGNDSAFLHSTLVAAMAAAEDAVARPVPVAAQTAASQLVGTGASSSACQFQCPYCTKGYQTVWSLGQHVKKSHDRGSLFHCHHCRFAAPDFATLRAHRRSAHDHRFRCPVCHKRFTLDEQAEHFGTCGK